MRLVRLFVDAPLQPGSELPLPEGAARHALRVLRMKAGHQVMLFNGDGQQYPARLTTDNPRAPRVRVEGVESPVVESRLRVTLLQAFARGEKMDWIIQKATELGVARIVPVVSERSEVRLDAARGDKRRDHWRAVAIAACEQSRRNLVPEVSVPMTLAAYPAAHADGEPGDRWMLHPGAAIGVHDLAPSRGSIVLAVGPEGGFGERDVSVLHEAGFREFALGPRILRTETAGIAALAALQTVYGDF
jgi:16S rRNA (uracil1498-N3)-methyltransferase